MTGSKNDLWASALNRLSKVDKQLFKFESQKNLDVVFDLHSLTESARDECIMKRWRITQPGGKGETVDLRKLSARLSSGLTSSNKLKIVLSSLTLSTLLCLGPEFASLCRSEVLQ